MSTTEDPEALSKEIARLQKENELMQQLLARQSLSTEAATAPGQASSGELLLSWCHLQNAHITFVN